jgi:hypothetical protein
MAVNASLCYGDASHAQEARESASRHGWNEMMSYRKFLSKYVIEN